MKHLWSNVAHTQGWAGRGDHNGGDLFAEYARKTDPDTSHMAAAHVSRSEMANRLETIVLEALKAHPNGLTNHGLVKVTGIDWNTITPRIAPLKRKGLVCDSGKRREGPTDRLCIVWRLT